MLGLVTLVIGSHATPSLVVAGGEWVGATATATTTATTTRKRVTSAAVLTTSVIGSHAIPSPILAEGG